MKQLSFKAYRRLAGPNGFSQVFSKKRFIYRNFFVRVVLSDSILHYSRLGCLIPKRHVPSAVRRNQIRRIIRAAFCASPLNQSLMDVVVHFVVPVKTLEQCQSLVAFHAAMQEVFSRGVCA